MVGGGWYGAELSPLKGEHGAGHMHGTGDNDEPSAVIVVVLLVVVGFFGGGGCCAYDTDMTAVYPYGDGGGCHGVGKAKGLGGGCFAGEDYLTSGYEAMYAYGFDYTGEGVGGEAAVGG